MGKPSEEAVPSPHLGESASAISLLTTSSSEAPIQRYFDDDPAELAVDDLPPLYSDHDRDTVAPIDPLVPANTAAVVQPFSRDKKTDTAYYVDRRLGSDAAFLETQLTALAQVPPRPYVHLRGVHTESVKRGDKTERKEIVDFDFQLELTSLLYHDLRPESAWRDVHAVSNFEKVRRGTVFATRAPGFGGSGAPEDGTPSLADWCWRYTSSSAGLKAFVLDRRIDGWDWDLVRGKLEDLIRSTNYRGRATVSFPIKNARVEIYNDTRTNHWRLTKWIEMLFVFTLLFLFAWPYLFFRTKRWETIYVEWRLSRTVNGRKSYVSMTEDHWYNLWGRALQKAILDRRQGLLDQSDLHRAEGAPAAAAEGLAAVVQAGADAMSAVNRSFGWGGDR